MQYEACPVRVIKRSGNIAAAVCIAMLLRRATMHCLSGGKAVIEPSLAVPPLASESRGRRDDSATDAAFPGAGDHASPPTQVAASEAHESGC